MKNKIKKLPFFKFLNYFRVKYILKKENNYSNKLFLKYYINSFSKSKRNYEYEIMLAIHQIEKGLSCKKLRPFGKDKVKNIIKDIDKIDIKSFVYNYGINILKKYVEVYDENKWSNEPEYIEVKDFLKSTPDLNSKMKVGSKLISFNDIKTDIDYEKFISTRHSIRNFSKRKLSDKDIEKAIRIASKSPTACNRQMCNIYYAKSYNSGEIIRKYAQGLGLFDFEGINYFIITYDVSSCLFAGEQYQGLFNAGLVSMNFVNGLHSLGIGSCFIQFGNRHEDEIAIKKQLNIPNCERIAIIIVAGYYDNVSKIPCSVRKNPNDIFFIR